MFPRHFVFVSNSLSRLRISELLNGIPEKLDVFRLPDPIRNVRLALAFFGGREPRRYSSGGAAG
jgi:hypothetical protein